VFRGVILAELINWARDSSKDPTSLRLRFWVGMVLAAMIFVLVHWPFWLSHFGLSATLVRSVPLLAFSLIVGFVFANTRSIWACIFLHYLNNQLSLLG
jgi:membrane protease YdiL (CAAX protease family)